MHDTVEAKFVLIELFGN
jgi:hypothetical protein